MYGSHHVQSGDWWPRWFSLAPLHTEMKWRFAALVVFGQIWSTNFLGYNARNINLEYCSRYNQYQNSILLNVNPHFQRRISGKFCQKIKFSIVGYFKIKITKLTAFLKLFSPSKSRVSWLKLPSPSTLWQSND